MVKNILVVGYKGYVGDKLIQYLVTNPNHRLYGYDTNFYKNSVISKDYNENYLTTIINDDIRNLSPFHLVGINTIICLAAISNDPMGSEFQKATEEINYKSTIHLAKIAKEIGVKNFIFASSCSVYGNGNGGIVDELTTPNPLTTYAKSKYQSEQELSKLANENFKVTCLRFATACGWSNRLRLDLVLNDFVYNALINNRIDIQSDGTPWRPLIDVEDMARAMDWAVHREGEPNIIVNIGSYNYDVKQIAQFVKDQLPAAIININPDAVPDKRSYRVNFDYFNKIAHNYIPQVTIQQSISNIINGLKANPIVDADDYIRLKSLNKLKADNLINANLEWI